MIFKNIYKAREWFLNYEPLEVSVPEFWTEYNHSKWKFGDYILFQHIKQIEKPHDSDTTISPTHMFVISRPILAIFTSFTVWDQALVVNFIQEKRAWTNHHQVVTNSENNYKMFISTLDDEIENIEFWNDNIYVINHWKNKPNLIELKSSLEKSIIPKHQLREQYISDILK